MPHPSVPTILAAASLLLSACTDNAAHRTRTIAAEGTDLVCEVENGANGRQGRTDCAIERHSYEVDLGFGEPEKHYHLAFVEFDDQGWFWDRKQMEALLRLLYRGTADSELHAGRDYLIFVFAHGWRHNAAACDNNVVCFQRMVERLDVLERVEAWRSGGNPRPVIGVYLGWRGLSANLRPAELLSTPLELASFWERKSTAHRVGLGGVTELLSRLNDFRRHKNPNREAGKTQLLLFGHSFGGKVVYSALSHSLIERAVFTETCDPGDEEWRTECRPDAQGNSRLGSLQYLTANSFGDLIVLLNPAFEGSIYEPLHHAATNRCYPDRQRPVMLVVTSQADDATRVTFPLGRFFSNMFESTRSGDQRDTIMNTVGHLGRYRTHELRLVEEEEGAEPATDTYDTGPCGCPYLASTADFVDKVLSRDIRVLREAKAAKVDYHPAGRETLREQQTPFEPDSDQVVTYGPELELIPNPDYARNFPYLVVYTDGKVIPSHNQIYSEPFSNFVRRFYIRHIRNQRPFRRDCWPMPSCIPSDIEPCEQSCRRGDGTSCSERVPPLAEGG